MELRKKCINTVITLKGFGAIEIIDDASRFDMYRNLGLDVFAKAKKTTKPDIKEDKDEKE